MYCYVKQPDILSSKRHKTLFKCICTYRYFNVFLHHTIRKLYCMKIRFSNVINYVHPIHTYLHS
jgi:hypothetical protein